MSLVGGNAGAISPFGRRAYLSGAFVFSGVTGVLDARGGGRSSEVRPLRFFVGVGGNNA